MNLRRIIRKTLIEEIYNKNLLSENIAQAEKLLKTNNLPLDNPQYIEVKNRLIKTNNIGYLGVIVKLAISDNGELKKLSQIYDFIENNKDILNKLPKQLQAYNTLNELSNDVETLRVSILIKKLADKLTNNIIKNILLNNSYEKSRDFNNNVNYFLKLKSSDQKEFLSKSDKYKDFDSFAQGLKNFNNDIEIGFTFNVVKTKISSMNPDEIKILFSNENKQMILARIIKYSASKMIGSQSWCIVGSENYFNTYTKDGKNFQYFFFNFNENVKPNEKMIAFTMDDTNEITAAHDRYDAEFSNVLGYLSNIGIKEKLVQINSRERQQNRLNKLGVNTKNSDYHDTNDFFQLNTYSNDEKIKGPNGTLINKPAQGARNYDENLNRVSLKFLTELLSPEIKSKNHLDIIVKKFEDYPVTDLNQDTRKKTQSSINIITQTLNKLNTLIQHSRSYQQDYFDLDNKSKEIEVTKPKVIDVIQKIYMSGIEIQKDTKIAIMHFLKDNGVDILKLSQVKKSKNGNDLTDMEFAMLKNKGENLTPIIQNKLSAIRRGDDVNLSVSEINYAIENGFKPIIEKYYKNMIPSFSEHQLSYEDMNVYKKLGLLNDVANVIFKKGNYWGLDTLNSIEKSIYDLFKKTVNSQIKV